MNKLNKIISKVLEIEEKSITDKTSPGENNTWDSFNNLLLISELENEFRIKFTISEISSMKSVKNIKDALKKHGVKL